MGNKLQYLIYSHWARWTLEKVDNLIVKLLSWKHFIKFEVLGQVRWGNVLIWSRVDLVLMVRQIESLDFFAFIELLCSCMFCLKKHIWIIEFSPPQLKQLYQKSLKWGSRWNFILLFLNFESLAILLGFCKHPFNCLLNLIPSMNPSHPPPPFNCRRSLLIKQICF